MLERVLVAHLKALVCTRRGGAEGLYELRTFLAQKEPARRKVRGAGAKTRGERVQSACVRFLSHPRMRHHIQAHVA